MQAFMHGPYLIHANLLNLVPYLTIGSKADKICNIVDTIASKQSMHTNEHPVKKFIHIQATTAQGHLVKEARVEIASHDWACDNPCQAHAPSSGLYWASSAHHIGAVLSLAGLSLDILMPHLTIWTHIGGTLSPPLLPPLLSVVRLTIRRAIALILIWIISRDIMLDLLKSRI